MANFGKERGKNGRKMGKWPKNGSVMAIFPFFGHFFAFFEVEPKSIFWPFFPISGRRPDLGSEQGTRDRKNRVLVETVLGGQETRF